MPYYIVNSNAQFGSGDHEVHQSPRQLCSSPAYPAPHNQVNLGYHDGCYSAVQAAKRLGYATANGCYYCSAACHTT
jgi:hypothetical protein